MHYSRGSAGVVCLYFFAAEGVGDDEGARGSQNTMYVLEGFLLVFQMGKHAEADNSIKRLWRKSRLFDVSEFHSDVFEVPMLCSADLDHVF